jgi:hypothetical protein
MTTGVTGSIRTHSILAITIVAACGGDRTGYGDPKRDAHTGDIDSNNGNGDASTNGSHDASANNSDARGTSADAGRFDAATTFDAAINLNPGGCVSGVNGTHAARFRWDGTQNSTAHVVYESNTLTDTARWKAGAFSRGAIGYSPVYSDTFLGVGGLEMGSTVFIDVELSTARLATLRHVTLSIFGRSFNTTTSGGYAWQTFDGSGETASTAVSNEAPYQWYRADATDAFVAGNDHVLLRISPTTTNLIIKRVELCFDAT